LMMCRRPAGSKGTVVALLSFIHPPRARRQRRHVIAPRADRRLSRMD
jgi:hypothetical protein